MYFISAYERVRAKYHANGAFPHLYDKVKPEIDVVKVGKEFMDPMWCWENVKKTTSLNTGQMDAKN